MKLSEFDINNPEFSQIGSWPLLIKLILLLAVFGIVCFAGYKMDVEGLRSDLAKKQNEETSLRKEFADKHRVLVNIDEYRAQIAEMQIDLDELLQQLPTETEMPDLLDDVSDTGRSNGLVFSLFQPQGEQPREFYAAKPIKIDAVAYYHQFGSFVGAIAALDRIVNVESMKITAESGNRGRPDPNQEQGLDGPLRIATTLQTYRYLSETEDDEAESPQ